MKLKYNVQLDERAESLDGLVFDDLKREAQREAEFFTGSAEQAMWFASDIDRAKMLEAAKTMTVDEYGDWLSDLINDYFADLEEHDQ